MSVWGIRMVTEDRCIPAHVSFCAGNPQREPASDGLGDVGMHVRGGGRGNLPLIFGKLVNYCRESRGVGSRLLWHPREMDLNFEENIKNMIHQLVA